MLATTSLHNIIGASGVSGHLLSSGSFYIYVKSWAPNKLWQSWQLQWLAALAQIHNAMHNLEIQKQAKTEEKDKRTPLLTGPADLCGVTLPQGHLWPDSGFLSSAHNANHDPARTCTLRHEPRLPGARRPGPIQAIIITQANICLATVDTIQ